MAGKGKFSCQSSLHMVKLYSMEIKNGFKVYHPILRQQYRARDGSTVPHNTEQVCDTHNAIILELCFISNSNLQRV